MISTFDRFLFKNRLLSTIYTNFFPNYYHPLSQAVLDEYNAIMYLKANKILRTRPYLEEDDKNIYNETFQLNRKERQQYLQREMDIKILELFQSIHDVLDGNEFKITNNELDDSHQTKILDKLNYSCIIKPSNVPDGGLGVFVQTKDKNPILPGSIVGLYPGKVFVAEHFGLNEVTQTLFNDSDENMMVMVRVDGVVIDGRSCDDVPFNPLSNGHLINHANPPLVPNVVPVAYDFASNSIWKSGFPKHLHKYIPNQFIKDRTILGSMDRSFFMHTIVLLSSRYIEDGDELYLDYRLNPNSKMLPSWYISCDIESAKRRWASNAELNSIM